MAGGPDAVTAVTATLMVAVAAFNVLSPLYCATMLLAPTWSCPAATVMLAEAVAPAPASAAAPIGWPPAVNVITPVGVAPLMLVTVAVMVIEPVAATDVVLACRATDVDARAGKPVRHAVTRLYAS